MTNRLLPSVPNEVLLEVFEYMSQAINTYTTAELLEEFINDTEYKLDDLAEFADVLARVDGSLDDMTADEISDVILAMDKKERAEWAASFAYLVDSDLYYRVFYYDVETDDWWAMIT